MQHDNNDNNIPPVPTRSSSRIVVFFPINTTLPSIVACAFLFPSPSPKKNSPSCSSLVEKPEGLEKEKTQAGVATQL